MIRAPTGQYLLVSRAGGEEVRAFMPAPLPPVPALVIGDGLRGRLDEALLALGRLDGVSDILPSADLFLYTYVRKEAVLSSQIEGTQSSLSDLLLFELDEVPGVPFDDVVESSNYVAAFEHGLRRLAEGFPISLRLIREIHARLMSRGRGEQHQPGEFRRTQNWIGGTRPGNAVFVPPPAERMMECLDALERWLHDDPSPTPILVKAALSHVQFETIHPFLDGNGRVGRLLITLLLVSDGVLRKPLLYLSHYFKLHRARYYDLLTRVRTEGAWEEWVGFFADGVRETADGAVATARRLMQLFEADRMRVARLGRGANSALRVHAALQQRPVANAKSLVGLTGLSTPTVITSLRALVALDVVREVTGRRRNRVYSYQAYVNILSEGTEPIRGG